MGIVVSIIPCRPQRRFWDLINTPGYCVNLTALALAGGVFNITTDLIILVLPVREVWKLNLPVRQKVALIVIFATGSAYVSPN